MTTEIDGKSFIVTIVQETGERKMKIDSWIGPKSPGCFISNEILRIGLVLLRIDLRLKNFRIVFPKKIKNLGIHFISDKKRGGRGCE